jgi:hypothetical protein
MAGMENEEREKQHVAGAGIYSLLSAMALALPLYVLSSGPAWFLLRARGLGKTWDVVYAPLVIVDFLPPLRDLHMQYVNWWVWLA